MAGGFFDAFFGRTARPAARQSLEDAAQAEGTRRAALGLDDAPVVFRPAGFTRLSELQVHCRAVDFETRMQLDIEMVLVNDAAGRECVIRFRDAGGFHLANLNAHGKIYAPYIEDISAWQWDWPYRYRVMTDHYDSDFDLYFVDYAVEERAATSRPAVDPEKLHAPE
jgi:hypothetical protein